MRWFRFTSVLVILMVAVPAMAQQRPAPVHEPLRGYLIGGGGTSINMRSSTSQSTLALMAEIAENVHSDAQVYIAAGWYDNVMSQAAQDQLVRVGTALTSLTGTPWVFEGRDRARYFSVGAKYLIPTGTPIRPYVGGGVGAINLRRTIHELSRGNVTRAFLAQFDSLDGVVDQTQSNTTKPMTEVAAGVGAVIKHAYVDVGYRYRKAFHNVIGSFDISQVGVAVGVKF